MTLIKALHPKLALSGIPVALSYLRDSEKLGVAIIDTTSQCNLSCTLCYYKREKLFKDLHITEWKDKWKRMKNQGIKFVTWTGGEPLLRRKLIEEGMKFFPFNSVFTNGTKQIPYWPKTVFYVSVDGTQPYYQKIRGNNYDTVKKNIRESPVPVNIAMVINKQNKGCLSEFADEWVSEANCACLVFDFYTPSSTSNDELTLTDGEKYQIVERLLELKNKYKSKILLSSKTIKNMRPELNRKIVGEKCVVRKFLCLDAQGNKKVPCTMVGSDCENCSHFIPHMFYSIFRGGDLEMLNSFFKYCIKI